MAESRIVPLRSLDEEAALRSIVEGTAARTGQQFFTALVENLAGTLATRGAWVTEYNEHTRLMRALAFRMGERWIDGFEYNVAGTPCEIAINEGRFVHYPDNIVALFPGDNEFLVASNAVSYMGAPLKDVDGRILGLLAVLDDRPMPNEPRGEALFRIFAARAAAELQRLRVEAELREREQKLGRLVNSAMDAIIELDHGLAVTRVNPAGEKAFRCAAGDVIGQDFSRFLAAEGYRKLRSLARELDGRPEGQRYLWIPGGLQALCADGADFEAEATLSRFEMQGGIFYTLILRNVNERLEAERRIRSLTVETEYLKEELKELHNYHEIVGRSAALQRVLRDVDQVATTDAGVLILGETGTGKELIARAIHATSPRRDRPLIKINCAAIPKDLVESELFGHEKGAFTGATQKREGRFALADGGTIFLDEIGELPVDLQVKLLRVLQEGEFEPVGGSQTRRVDVRVIAATNRDLARAIAEGEFREDLYYRLSVFPVLMPPLRERDDDVVLLAHTFVDKFARKIGRSIQPLSPECMQRLRSYHWPGNVRELQNVIERGVITARDGQLDLERALPDGGIFNAAGREFSSLSEPIHTMQELQDLERRNIIRALETTGWRVSGDDGAAQLLGMNPSTLSSRIKTLGITRPAQH